MYTVLDLLPSPSFHRACRPLPACCALHLCLLPALPSTAISYPHTPPPLACHLHGSSASAPRRTIHCAPNLLDTNNYLDMMADAVAHDMPWRGHHRHNLGSQHPVTCLARYYRRLRGQPNVPGVSIAASSSRRRDTLHATGKRLAAPRAAHRLRLPIPRLRRPIYANAHASNCGTPPPPS